MPFRPGVKLTEEHKAKLKAAQKKRFAEGHNLTAFKKGHIPTPEMRAKMGSKGECSPMWKGGITRDKQKYRQILRGRNGEVIRDYFREWKKTHRDSVNAYTNNYRAMLRNAEGSFTPAEWEAKKLEFRNVCANCGGSGKLTVDHIIPISKAGSNYISNIQPLCLKCNCTKSDMLMEEFDKYQCGVLELQISEIKRLFQTEYLKAKQAEVNDNIYLGHTEFIRYLQDQVNKITGESNEQVV